MKSKILTLSTIAALFFIGCNKDDNNDDEQQKLAAQVAAEQAVINDVVNNVIVPTYHELDTKTNAMVTALTSLENNATVFFPVSLIVPKLSATELAFIPT